ncbi:MAG: hypothetical protein SVY15_07040 [Halobacteriota archaeon]|nr:hypothetical protein [Halobacteriota archaeon]
MLSRKITFLQGLSIWEIFTLFGFIGGLIGILWYFQDKILPRFLKKKTVVKDEFPFKAIEPTELESDLTLIVKGLKYVERPKSLTKASEEKIGTLIVGKPNAGKSREGLEVVRGINRDITVLIPKSRTSIPPFKVPQDIKGDVVLFFDDLPNYYVNPKEFSDSLKRAIKMLEGTSNSVYTVATARTTKLDRVTGYPADKFWKGFDIIELDEFGENETLNLIDELCNHFNISIEEDAKSKIMGENDRTPKNIVFFFNQLNDLSVKHISIVEANNFKSTVKESWEDLYNKLKEDERSIFKAIDVIYECGVIPHREFVSSLSRRYNKSRFIFCKRRIEKSIDQLIEKHLIVDKESLILCDDIYREGKGDVEGNVKNLIKILFRASKDKNLIKYVNISIMGFSDGLSHNRNFLDENIKLTRKIIELNPDLALAHNNLGVLFNDLKSI